MLRALDSPSTAWKVLWTFVAVILLFAGIGAFISGPIAAEISSFFILLVTASICQRIFIVRRLPTVPAFKSPARIWLLIAIGFLYLALDEALSIHEAIDHLIHWLFGISETGFTDRIDDVFVLIYGIIGLVIIYYHRQEFRVFSDQKGLLVLGFVFLGLMVAADAGANRSDVALLFGLNAGTADRWVHWMGYVEEFLKLIAECVFLVAFARIYERASAPLRDVGYRAD